MEEALDISSDFPWISTSVQSFLASFIRSCSLSINQCEVTSPFTMVFIVSLHTTCKVCYSENKCEGARQIFCLGTFYKHFIKRPWMLRKLVATSDKLLSYTKEGPLALKET